MSRPPAEARRIWTAPLLIAVAMLVSLVVALVEEGFWDAVAAATLFGMLAYATALGWRRVEKRGGR